MSEPYLFPKEFSGDLAEKMVVEEVRKGIDKRIRECECLWEKMKRKEEQIMSVAGQREKRDILKMSGGEQIGRWGHTCGSPKI